MTRSVRRLSDAVSAEIPAGEAIVLVPLGSTEQHGPHLPLDTDTRIAVAIAEAAAARRTQVWVAPAMPYGSSGEHAAFTGTLSIGTDVLRSALIEVVRSAAASFRAVIFVNGHGGNVEAIRSAVNQMQHEGHAVTHWWPTVSGGDAHAGRTETSLMLAIAPDSVLVDALEAGETAPLRELLPAMREGGVIAVSENGVLGDPTGASVEEGAMLLDQLVQDLLVAVDESVAGQVNSRS